MSVEKCIYLRRSVTDGGRSEKTECLANGAQVECGGFSDACEYSDLFISDRGILMEQITFNKQEPMPDFSHYDSLWEGKTVKQSELNDQEADMTYVALIMDHVVGQFTMDEDIEYRLNTEKYKPVKKEEPKPEPRMIVTHGVQAQLNYPTNHYNIFRYY